LKWQRARLNWNILISDKLKYREYKQSDFPGVADEVLDYWKANNIFQRSVDEKEGAESFVFYEGPPSANGLPGIHHVMARAIKDIFCRYKTLKGFQVKRKAGWDTHGLPVELSVEKKLGITKEDIGKKISVDDYNKECRATVMQYTDVWNDLTEKMGYWVDMNDPYITYENKYIESVWWLLGQLHKKKLIYKGYTIQPYSPAAGTGLSTHELNQPGCYRDVKDTTVVAQFKLKDASKLGVENAHILAWTTTPWTLPSNTALAVGKKIDYVLVSTFNQYTFERINVVLAKALVSSQFSGKFEAATSEADLSYKEGDKKIPFFLQKEMKGVDLLGLEYEQLLPYTLPHENPEKAFRVIPGDFVTTEDGTGIVHISPTFGQDDAMVAKAADIPAMLVLDNNENLVPLVDLQGKFRPEMGELGGLYVKNEYYKDGEAPDKSVDVLLAIKLKEENKAFNVSKYEHSYPHCWRTDKPVLYYPLDSWFIKSTAAKDRMIELNKTINWQPESTGVGRFGNWLENLNDWNLSRSRYWGIPIPIWRTEEGDEEICISSVEELKGEIEKSIEAGFMTQSPLNDFIVGDMSKANYNLFDLHKNYVDDVVLVASNGKPMKRESDLIDVWFDSGSMPYAQLHYPFENKEEIDNNKFFPADFIAEGVDQTRGWFFTLHAIGVMVFDSVAYKNVMSNGLVLDNKGQKMSKRLGNATDPFETLKKYGPDATRWYMIANANPWDNLRFNIDGIAEVQRRFFGTLYNTYNFFALYANLDGFDFSGKEIPLSKRTESDRWVLSKLNSVIEKVDAAYADYEPTKAARLIQDFTTDDLSNWYVRLNRKRFWKGEYNEDKRAAYQTLYTCLVTVAKLGSSIAPFYMDRLFCDLNSISQKESCDSIHLSDFPAKDNDLIDESLEAKMDLAQRVSSLVHSLRKKEMIKVRQPLSRILIPVLNTQTKEYIEALDELILSEVNVKAIEFIDDTSGILVKKIKPNFKILGRKFGPKMKSITRALAQLDKDGISKFEREEEFELNLGEEHITLTLEDVEISSEDIPGWLVANDGKLTVALDVSISDELKYEGIARDIVNRIQNLRKDMGMEVQDKIIVSIGSSDETVNNSLINFKEYICEETQAKQLNVTESLAEVEILEMDEFKIAIKLEVVK
jgi:isoleucyl-tRNA synthetase